MIFFRVIVTVFVVFGSSVAFATELESKDDDAYLRQRGIDDRMAFFVGGMSAHADTTAQINSASGIGTTLALQRLFSLPTERNYLRLQGYYRFSRTHRLDFRYLRLASAGTNTLFEDEINVGPLTFQLGAAIGARQETRFGVLDYRYAYINDGRVEAGLSAGLGVAAVDLTVFGEIGISPGPVLSESVRTNETLPLPVIGLYTDLNLTRRLFFSVEGLLFSANYSKYSGDVSDFRAALRWHPTNSWGFGLAFNRTRIDIEVERSKGDFSLDYFLQGPSMFVTFLVPGSK